MYNVSDKLKTISNTSNDELKRKHQIEEANNLIKMNKKADKIYKKCISICEKQAKKGHYNAIIKVEVVWWIYLIFHHLFYYLSDKYLAGTPLDCIFYFQSYKEKEFVIDKVIEKLKNDGFTINVFNSEVEHHKLFSKLFCIQWDNNI